MNIQVTYNWNDPLTTEFFLYIICGKYGTKEKVSYQLYKSQAVSSKLHERCYV